MRRWLRRFLQWLFGTFYEGPVPPVRLSKGVEAFAFSHPVASREEWIEFARVAAEEAYKAGYERGYEQRVADITNVLGTVVVPMTQPTLFREYATPHKLETEAAIAEKVEFRSESGKVVKHQIVTLEEAFKVDPELRAAEEEYWFKNAGIRSKR